MLFGVSACKIRTTFFAVFVPGAVREKRERIFDKFYNLWFNKRKEHRRLCPQRCCYISYIIERAGVCFDYRTACAAQLRWAGRSSMAKKQEYGNESITSLKGADRVRKRPAVIFGSDGVEGCAHSIFEIVSNSIDEARDGHGDTINVTRCKDGSVIVEDFGRGMPVDWNKGEERYNWELLFCEMYAGGKYGEGEDNYEFSLGLNGLGLCATQYASAWMTADIYRDGFHYHLDFQKGENVGGLHKEPYKGRRTGSIIHWKPDDEVFTDIDVPGSYYKDVLRRQAVVNAGLTLNFTDEKEKDPATGKPWKESWCYEHGIADYVAETAGEDSLTPVFSCESEATGRDREDQPDYKVKMSAAFCFSLTISTVGDKYNNSHFRFVANNDAHQNWGETDGNISSNTGFARSTYDAADDGNHSCMADDPNDVQFRTTAREDEEGFGSTTPNQKDILWNRPEGIWTVRFYPELDKDGKDISRYTISGTKVIKIPFTRCVGKFIRTYSNNVAMVPVNDNVKVYEAYKYEKTENAKDPQSQGTVYLRQLKYIPANMGVVLVGKQPAEGTFSDGNKLDFFLMEAPADILVEGDNYTAVWTKADDYVNDEWNNYLKPTVTAIDNLGNADTDADGKILHRFFGLANFHSTKYYKENQTGDDYIGFFRFTQNGQSGANKAYLSIPANTVIDGGAGAKFGYIDFNGQFLGNETDDDPNNPSLAKMAIVFDDEDDGGSTTTVTEVKPNSKDGDASFYTLQGVKVSRPVKGVYIHNGKKFIK